MSFHRAILEVLARTAPVDRALDAVDAAERLNRPSETTSRETETASIATAAARSWFLSRARGIVASWPAPCWLARQSDPADASVVPGSASADGNLRRRDWTRMAAPGGRTTAVVDPRGTVSPSSGGWSLEAWVRVLPVAERAAGRRDDLPWERHGWVCFGELPDGASTQRIAPDSAVITETVVEGVAVALECRVRLDGEGRSFADVAARFGISGGTRGTAALEFAWALRPFDHDGLNPVRNVAYNTRGFWNIEGRMAVMFATRPHECAASAGSMGGDVFEKFAPLAVVSPGASAEPDGETIAHCPAGLATAASRWVIDLAAGSPEILKAVVPLEAVNPRTVPLPRDGGLPFGLDAVVAAVDDTPPMPGLAIGGPAAGGCFGAALRALATASTAGPRPMPGQATATLPAMPWSDAGPIIEAMAAAGHGDAALACLGFIPLMQWKNGYLGTARGQMDANGRALVCAGAVIERLSAYDEAARWWPALRRAALFIEAKRHDVTLGRGKPRGLLGAGLAPDPATPNDFWFADNFHSLAGMLAMVRLAAKLGRERDAEGLAGHAAAYRRDLDEAVNRELERRTDGVLPAAPRRTPDETAARNLAAAWPLALEGAAEARWTTRTAEFVASRFMRAGGLWSPARGAIDTAATFRLARARVRMGLADPTEALSGAAALASPTGRWPARIDPATGHGCGGDGDDVVTAAEFVLLALETAAPATLRPFAPSR